MKENKNLTGTVKSLQILMILVSSLMLLLLMTQSQRDRECVGVEKRE